MIFWLWLGCATTGSVEHLATATLDVAGKPVIAEIAATYLQRQAGLQHRDTMGPDEGMLFVYTEEKPRSFWMKDTYLPLTIAYADRKGVIVKIADMTPLDESNVQSLFPAMYALEMNKGWYAAHGVVEGDKISNIPLVEAE